MILICERKFVKPDFKVSDLPIRGMIKLFSLDLAIFSTIYIDFHQEFSPKKVNW